MTGDLGVIPLSIGVSDFSNWDISFVLVFGDVDQHQKKTASEFLSDLLNFNVSVNFVSLTFQDHILSLSQSINVNQSKPSVSIRKNVCC